MLANGTLLQQRYRIKRLLAQGGMGAVYEAEAVHLGNTPVAVKETLFTEAERRMRDQFEREAVTLARLRHPALPRVSDHFTEGAGQFLVMEFVPGEDMFAALRRHGRPFDWPQVAAWADRLLDALDYIHSQSPPVIHRDIKPQNLKLTPRGELFLIDFGLAKSSTTPSHTSASLHAYTLAYAPPEQISGAGTDPRSDLYSLAATLYHLMAGGPPTDARVREEVIRHGAPDPLRPLRQLSSRIPSTISAVIERGLALDRNQRYPGAAAMRAALRQAGQLSATTVRERADKDVRAPEAVRTEQMPPEEIARIERIERHASPRPSERAVTQRPIPPALTEPFARAKRNSTAILFGAAAIFGLIVVAGYFAVNALRPGNGQVITGPLVITQSSPKAGATPEAATPSTSGVPQPGAVANFEFETVTLDGQGNETSRQKKQGRQWVESLGNRVTLELVEIPGGAFLIGSPGDEQGRFPMEGPQRRVSLPSFWMGKFEVTQAQWREVAKLPRVKTDLVADQSLPVFKDDEMPVNGVSWDDAIEFCARLSQASGRAYRLPGEAEWEYAARAGTTTPTAFGPTITPALANCARQSPMFVGRLKVANAFGLYDLHGNVAEWCQDEWRENYDGMSSDGSWTNRGNAGLRPVRGSNWGLADLRFCRSALRLYDAPNARNYLYGLRVITSSPVR